MAEWYTRMRQQAGSNLRPEAAFFDTIVGIRTELEIFMKPLGRVSTTWSLELAYVIGLITTDSSLSIDGRHISITSKDLQLMETVKQCLGLSVTLGRKSSGHTSEKKYFVIQFGDVIFYRFLQSIGLTPAKTHTIGPLNIPDRYFFDFLRGHFDGDGSSYSYYDPRWHRSFLFYMTFISASREHVLWLRREITRLTGLRGAYNPARGPRTVHQLRFAKREAVKLVPRLYSSPDVPCLERKRLKIKESLRTLGLVL